MTSKRLRENVFYLFLILFFAGLTAQGQNRKEIEWKTLKDGLLYSEIDAPEKSIVNDSKLTLLKIDPNKYKFSLLSASEHGRKSRPADGWAEEFGMNIIVNAGMFKPSKARTNKGYMRNYSHVNNPKLNGAYNVMMAMNPKNKTEPSFRLFDLTFQSWDSIRPHYNTFCQGMRMIDGKGAPLAWDKRPGQQCSMLVGATDIEGNIYLLFTRSPYTHQQIICFLMAMPLNIRTTVYLEGGPEASLYINTGDTIISKLGCYVSKTYERDDNDHFWKIPNVIGITKK
jgi:hypothetical protein